MSEIDNLVQQWLAIDVNPVTRQQIINLHQQNDTAQLRALLATRISFGTAGLRARMEAGFSRMNDVTVLQASQGLAVYVQARTPTGSIVVGHDHRHNSRRFAELTAGAFLLRGMKVYYLGNTDTTSDLASIVATPLVPFAVDHHDASCGVMVTASHNPAADNGYKVYWGNGCQIIPPHDHGISESILDSLPVEAGSWDTTALFARGKQDGLLVDCREEMISGYIAAIGKKLVCPSSTVTDVRFVYTPMHGVGLPFVTKAFEQLGFASFVTVKEQALPNPEFPTVEFPNPEEKGALALAMREADSQNIDLVIANDPDADRFSVAVKNNGAWRQLTGNEIGFLFADYTIEIMKARGTDLSQVFLLNSTVSSQMIGSLATVEKCHYQDTLTGFKWIGNKALDLEAQGFKVPFAYEEAIGFMFSVVHDKDGISAAVVWLQMVDAWNQQGTNAVERLERGFGKYGFFKEHNGYYVVPDLSLTKTIFDSEIRTESHPSHIGEFSVVSWRDLTVGYDSTTADNVPVLPSDPSSQMITATLTTKKQDCLIRLTARGSGTEPKLKVYIEGKADTEEKAAQCSRKVWETLREVWFKPKKYGLKEVA
ncbi:hypothetical protein BABINDRAFT_6071 [Babjeviella inositovora NRRL Y-12698]|uniref:Phosphoglucomutase n=1 Tax=Babjeviella inositovora NRRL Y-12698 TaxID=984486 RepID=A0A1E3R088_9ASCO|nr:uncharacterized protein BABINDRAFT_6071 [Babjeviella inositovora NRRL Y-12698]ODQ83224.1 hypothetical protein BABINDRAFT_6071 [Babjeviella inositovora NRRL Y-12698]